LQARRGLQTAAREIFQTIRQIPYGGRTDFLPVSHRYIDAGRQLRFGFMRTRRTANGTPARGRAARSPAHNPPEALSVRGENGGRSLGLTGAEDAYQSGRTV